MTSNRSRSRALGGSAIAALLLCAFVMAAQAAEDCSPVLARVVSVQGTVQLRRAGADWKAAELDAKLCAGDMFRVLQRSRAALILSNETTLRLDQGTTLTLAPPDAGGATLLEQLSGGLRVITRTPRPFKVKTPFVNANVEGTEFVVRVGADDVAVAVVEGVVVAANDIGSVTIAGGEEAIAARDAAPRKEIRIRPRDAVAWTLYFPSIFDDRPGAGDNATLAGQARLRSIDLYRRGMLADALATLDGVPEREMTPKLLTYRAGLLLLVGRLDQAKPTIQRALELDVNHADAYSLLAVIAVAENDKDLALDTAQKASRLDPTSAAAQIALSYAWQARFKLEQALESAQRATELDAQHALAWARLAELYMASGDLDRALTAVQRAVDLDPALAKNQTVFGFANLARIDTRAAKASFEKAIALDQADPMPRLGLGLAKIREGSLEAGRIEIEIATSLDPENSLIRSYLGKAYYEERRDRPAASQLQLAEQIDPRDPTPWFYDAIRKQSENRPVDALADLNRSIELNDNRAIYRSQLLIDDDRAARSTSLAVLYGELGFERLAIVESVKALADNLGNDAAHRELASAYANLPRHDIARVSEALQAQIRQPVTLSPIDPQISTDNLGILRGSGPARLGANEFNLLFARDQTRLQADAIAGTRGTLGDQVVVSGLAGRFAYSASQLHYETDGFSDNDGARKNAIDLFVQGQVTPQISLQAEVRHTDLLLGQTLYPFDPVALWAQTIKDRSDTARLSGRVEYGASSDWIFSLSDETRVLRADNFPDGSPITEIRAKTRTYALQYLRRAGNSFQFLLGLESLRTRNHLPFEGVDVDESSETLYAYAQWRVVPSRLSLQAGITYDHYEALNPFFPNPLERRRVSPKLGVVWTPQAGTTVRAAAVSSIKRPFISSQTLEPTQLAGFNQFFTGYETVFGDPVATISRRFGLGVDHRFSDELFTGIEISARRLAVPVWVQEDIGWKESSAHVYLYHARPAGGLAAMPGWALAGSLEYEVEKLKRPLELTGPEAILDVTTHRLPIGLRLFRGSWALRASLTYVRQSGDFSAGPGADTFAKASQGWISDLSADYHLPRRAGTLTIGVRNLSDRHLDLFESDRFTPRDALRRLVYLRCRVLF